MRGIRALVSVALAVGVITGPAGHAAMTAASPTPLGLCQLSAADAPPTHEQHGLPATFCVRTVADLVAYVRDSGSPVAPWLAPRMRRAASGSEDRFCLSGALSGWDPTPDMTGDGHPDVLVIMLAGCTPTITLTLQLVDGLTGRTRWRTHVTSFLPLPYLTSLGTPSRPGVLVTSYDGSWQLAQQQNRPYQGTALEAFAFDRRGSRVWHLAVPADVQADGSYTAPTDAQTGNLVAGPATDFLYSKLSGSGLEVSGLYGVDEPSVTNIFVDGRNGRSTADPTLQPGPATPAYPQVVGDIDGDGRDDYVLIGGLEISSPVGVIGPNGEMLPPPVHRLVVAAHAARTHAQMWSRTFDLPLNAFFVLVRDFDGDQWPEIAGVVFPDDFSGDIRGLLLSGGNGTVLMNHAGWPVDVLRYRLRTPLLAMATIHDDGQTAGVRVDAYALAGWHRHITDLRVPYPKSRSSFGGSSTAMFDEGDLDSDGFDELGLLIATSSGSVTNRGSTLVGSNLSVHHLRLAFYSNQPGWQPLYDSIRGRDDDLYRLQHHGSDGWRLELGAGLNPHELLSIAVSAKHRPFEVDPTVLTDKPRAECRSMIVGAFRDRVGGPLTLARVEPGTGRVRWQRTVVGTRFPIHTSVTQRARCSAHD